MPDFRSTDVDSGRVSNTAGSIDQDISELQAISKIIESGVIPNLTPYWQGQAKESFEQQFNFFALELKSLVEGYQELNEQLRKAGAAYGKADDSVQQIIRRLSK